MTATSTVSCGTLLPAAAETHAEPLLQRVQEENSA
jgi:hypothetical protein